MFDKLNANAPAVQHRRTGRLCRIKIWKPPEWLSHCTRVTIRVSQIHNWVIVRSLKLTLLTCKLVDLLSWAAPFIWLVTLVQRKQFLHLCSQRWTLTAHPAKGIPLPSVDQLRSFGRAWGSTGWFTYGICTCRFARYDVNIVALLTECLR